MEEIKKCMRQARSDTQDRSGVMDTNGLIIASTDPDIEGQTDSAARAVMISDDMFSCTSDKTYMKIAVTVSSSKYISLSRCRCQGQDLILLYRRVDQDGCQRARY